MRYIKSYENVNLKYHEGDYVYIDDDKLEPFCKILMVNSKLTDRSWDYFIDAFDIKKNKFRNTYTAEFLIYRKLTQEEINEFEAKKDAVKYNL